MEGWFRQPSPKFPTAPREIYLRTGSISQSFIDPLIVAIVLNVVNRFVRQTRINCSPPHVEQDLVF